MQPAPHCMYATTWHDRICAYLYSDSLISSRICNVAYIMNLYTGLCSEVGSVIREASLRCALFSYYYQADAKDLSRCVVCQIKLQNRIIQFQKVNVSREETMQSSAESSFNLRSRKRILLKSKGILTFHEKGTLINSKVFSEILCYKTRIPKEYFFSDWEKYDVYIGIFWKDACKKISLRMRFDSFGNKIHIDLVSFRTSDKNLSFSS